MPAFFLDTPDILPLPSLQAYTTISVLLLSCSIYYAFQVTSEPDWKLNATLSLGLTLAATENNLTRSLADADGGIFVQSLGLVSAAGNENINETSSSYTLGLLLDNTHIVRLIDILYLMFREPLCAWTLINMAYCCLILVGKIIQNLVFGELRVSEQQHIKDRFWNFVFYKFIFIFGVLNVQYMDEVVLWCSWFSFLGFLSLLCQLCKDRFEYLSFSPMTPRWTHTRLLLLLLGLLAGSVSLYVVCGIVGLNAGINTFAFMIAECSLVTIRTLYVLTRYGIHLWDLNHEGVWDNRASIAYYSELVFELVAFFLDFVHHLHMLFWGNIILSVASLVILMQLRYLFYEIRRRIRKHNNYLQVVRLMEANFPMASRLDLEKNQDDCAICWDQMEAARKLPCGHLFHNSCLRSWLEQDTSCPTCRTSLKHRTEGDRQSSSPDGQSAATTTEGEIRANAARALRNHFFHFDGSRYASWLPSVSVEVTRPHVLNIALATPAGHPVIDLNPANPNSQLLEGMAHQVQEWFPHLPLHVIQEDLMETRSVEATMDNVLDGRLVGPQVDSEDSGVNTDASISNFTPSSPPVLSEVVLKRDSIQGTTASDATNTISPVDAASASESKTNSEDAESSRAEQRVPVSSISYGGRFSKNPPEREEMLAKRKDSLMEAARRNYLSKSKPVSGREKLTQ